MHQTFAAEEYPGIASYSRYSVAASRRDEFTLKAFQTIGIQCPDEKVLKKKPLAGPVRKKARKLPPRIDPVPLQRGRPAVTLLGDSELVVNWASGQAYCRSSRHMDLIQVAHETCYGWWAQGHAAPAEGAHEWYGHIYREHNAEADHLAGRGAAGANHGFVRKRVDTATPYVALRGFFDGSGGKPSQDEVLPNAGAGWKLYCWYQGASSWEQVARACTCLGKVGSAVAELTALYQLTPACDRILRTGQIVWSQPGWIGSKLKPCNEGADSRQRDAKRGRT